MTLPEEENPVLELRMRVEEEEDEKGSYVKLSEGLEKRQESELEETEDEGKSDSSPFWFWVKLSVLFIVLAALAIVGYIWIGPLIMDKELIPIIQWEIRTFTHPVCGLLVFASVAIFPTILLPSTPSMWIAGMTFGYGYGFLLIISAAAVGVSLPYFIGQLFCHKIQGWLARYPNQAAVLRAAGEGNWLHQFRLVTLIRVSPFPYILYNYCAVATRVKYGPYITGSLIGMVPEVFVAIYTVCVLQRDSCKDISRSIFCRRAGSLGHTGYSQHIRLFSNSDYNDSHHKVCEKTAGDYEERGGSIVAVKTVKNPRDKL